MSRISSLFFAYTLATLALAFVGQFVYTGTVTRSIRDELDNEFVKVIINAIMAASLAYNGVLFCFVLNLRLMIDNASFRTKNGPNIMLFILLILAFNLLFVWLGSMALYPWDIFVGVGSYFGLNALLTLLVVAWFTYETTCVVRELVKHEADIEANNSELLPRSYSQISNHESNHPEANHPEDNNYELIPRSDSQNSIYDDCVCECSSNHEVAANYNYSLSYLEIEFFVISMNFLILCRLLELITD